MFCIQILLGAEETTVNSRASRARSKHRATICSLFFRCRILQRYSLPDVGMGIAS